MKKIKILSFLVFLISYVNAQEVKFSSKRLKYFQYINKAELSICKANYTNAIGLYDSALCLVNNPTYRDLYNLALCHKCLGNTYQTDSLFFLLLSEGYGKNYIRNCYDTIKNTIPQRKPTLINGKNLEIIFADIFKDDQRANSVRFRSMEEYAQMVIDNSTKIMSYASKIDGLLYYDVNGLLFFPMLHYFQLKGFSERVKTDSVFKKHWILFRCLEKIDFEKIKLLDFLKEQVNKGYYDRYNLASLLSENGYYFGEPLSQYNDYVVLRLPEVICKDDLKYINDSRKSLELESYEDYFKKARFTDSLLTGGKPFLSLPFDKHSEMMNEFENTCNFRIVKDYRKMMEFDSPDDAKKVYERSIERLCNRK